MSKIAFSSCSKREELLEANSKVDVTILGKQIFYWLGWERILQIGLMPIFCFIHCNKSNTAADGTETYVMGMNKVASNLEAAKRTLLLH
jgi:N-acetylmuramoyl-L-alanine amidase